jgi:hypothetical protein
LPHVAALRHVNGFSWYLVLGGFLSKLFTYTPIFLKNGRTERTVYMTIYLRFARISSVAVRKFLNTVFINVTSASKEVVERTEEHTACPVHFFLKFYRFRRN